MVNLKFQSTLLASLFVLGDLDISIGVSQFYMANLYLKCFLVNFLLLLSILVKVSWVCCSKQTKKKQANLSLAMTSSVHFGRTSAIIILQAFRLLNAPQFHYATTATQGFSICCGRKIYLLLNVSVGTDIICS